MMLTVAKAASGRVLAWSVARLLTLNQVDATLASARVATAAMVTLPWRLQ